MVECRGGKRCKPGGSEGWGDRERGRIGMGTRRGATGWMGNRAKAGMHFLEGSERCGRQERWACGRGGGARKGSGDRRRPTAADGDRRNTRSGVCHCSTGHAPHARGFLGCGWRSSSGRADAGRTQGGLGRTRAGGHTHTLLESARSREAHPRVTSSAAALGGFNKRPRPPARVPRGHVGY